MSDTYDVVIIGSGPGGYVAAISAAQEGLKVAVIEKEELGGMCLNWGCIPTKTLLSSAELFSDIKGSKSFGINVSSCEANMEGIIKRKDAVTDKLRSGIRSLLKTRGVDVINGVGRLKSKREVSVEGGETITAKNIIIATGSRPIELDFARPDGRKVLSIKDILNLNEIPNALTIIGGGFIGCEIGCIFNRLGSKVTIIEMLDEILPTADKEIAKRARGLFKRAGITIKTSTRFASLEGAESDKVLVAIGMVPNSEGLGLEEAGVKTERGRILVDKHMKTNIEGVYAIGDVIGGYLLAHIASYEGLVAVENIAGKMREADYSVVPSCIFTEPEIAAVGINEEEAKARGMDFKVGTFPFNALGRSHTISRTDGIVKLISDAKGDKVLGSHILGPHASELIHEAAIAIRLGGRVKDIEDMIHAHPTFSEAIKEAAEGVSGRPIHKL